MASLVFYWQGYISLHVLLGSRLIALSVYWKNGTILVNLILLLTLFTHGKVIYQSGKPSYSKHESKHRYKIQRQFSMIPIMRRVLTIVMLFILASPSLAEEAALA